MTLNSKQPKQKQTKPGTGNSRSARRRRNKSTKQPSVSSNSNGTMMPVFTSGPMVSDLFRRPGRGGIGANTPLARTTRDGEIFLKSCFAAPDFAGQGSFNGIPDDVAYPIVPYRHLMTGDFYGLLGLSPPTPSERLCIIQPPIPGVAFYWTLLPTGSPISTTTVFKPIFYDDFTSIFPPGLDNNSLVNSFRMAANSIEFVCTSNANNWSGSIRAFKGKLMFGDCNTYTVGTQTFAKSITGAEFTNSTSSATFTAPANLGVFMTGINSEQAFTSKAVPDSMSTINGGDPNSFAVFEGTFTGLGDLETNCIWLEGTVATQFAVRVWSAVEYIPVQGTLLSKMAHQSPGHDPVAMELYRRVVEELPVAVSYFNNDSFWQTLLGVFKKVTGVLANVPGPIGLISGGLNAVGGLIG